MSAGNPLIPNFTNFHYPGDPLPEGQFRADLVLGFVTDVTFYRREDPVGMKYQLPDFLEIGEFLTGDPAINYVALQRVAVEVAGVIGEQLPWIEPIINSKPQVNTSRRRTRRDLERWQNDVYAVIPMNAILPLVPIDPVNHTHIPVEQEAMLQGLNISMPTITIEPPDLS